MTADLRKIAIFINFGFLHILPANEWLFTFQLSWCQVVMFSLIFKGFLENQKKFKISLTAYMRKIAIFA